MTKTNQSSGDVRILEMKFRTKYFLYSKTTVASPYVRKKQQQSSTGKL